MTGHGRCLSLLLLGVGGATELPVGVGVPAALVRRRPSPTLRDEGVEVAHFLGTGGRHPEALDLLALSRHLL